MDKEERVDGVDCFGNELKVGDLVETCNMLPGFIVWQNPDDKDEVEVITMGKIGQYQLGRGGGHSIVHCGVHKCSEERATWLCALGEERLIKIAEEKGWGYYDNDECMKKEFENLIKEAHGTV